MSALDDPARVLPVSLLEELRAHLTGFALIGSFARDYWVHGVAGLSPGALTLDVDITILAGSMEEYRERVRALDGPRGTGLVFSVHGHTVDVIPYGDVAVGGIVEPAPGVTLDVTGMAESVEHAVEIGVGTGVVLIPTLASMIGLKLIAWAYRSASTVKDARDLGPLLDATHHGPFADALWRDDESCERWDYDDVLVGPYRAGRELGTTWREESLHALIETCDRNMLDELAARISRESRGRTEIRREQLAALLHGVRET